MIRSTPESEFDDLQVGYFEALQAYEAQLCGGCGGHRPETTDPAHDYNNPTSVLVYQAVPGTPVQCHRCAAIDRSQRETDARRPQHPTAMLHAVHLAPKPPPVLPMI